MLLLSFALSVQKISKTLFTIFTVDADYFFTFRQLWPEEFDPQNFG
jgi:hypothetical protein